MNEEDKFCVIQRLEIAIEDVKSMGTLPTKDKTYGIIMDLYEVMRMLSDASEGK